LPVRIFLKFLKLKDVIHFFLFEYEIFFVDY